MKRALLIVNPYSSQVTGPSISAVENALRERIDVHTRFTQYPGHATELAAAAAAEPVDGIVVFSGGEAKDEDGIMNEVRAIRDGGGNGSIMGRNAFQRSPADGAKLLRDAMAIFKG